MQAKVIAVSRTIGGGGEAVGRMVSDALGFRYIDEEIITGAAKKAGVNPDLVADAEKRKGLLMRFVDGLNAAAMTSGRGFMFTGAEGTERSEDFRALIREAVREVADQGDVVIVAHAASIALAGREDLLRVLITASPEMRVYRVADLAKVSMGEAKDIVKRSDQARADYIKRFYDTDHELPTHYDLVVNTDAVSPEEAANAVIAIASGGATPPG